MPSKTNQERREVRVVEMLDGVRHNTKTGVRVVYHRQNGTSYINWRDGYRDVKKAADGHLEAVIERNSLKPQPIKLPRA